ncbi:MAG: FecR domain-containing protein [Pseudomonadota bacterium]
MNKANASSEHNSQEIPYDVLESAAEWFAELRDGEADKTVLMSWQNWINQSPVHRKAWEFIANVGQEIHVFETTNTKQLASEVLDKQQKVSLNRRNVLFGIAVLGSVGVASLFVTSNKSSSLLTSLTADQSTRTGEVLSNVQGDGTRFWLNTQTGININQTQYGQQFELLKGELLIKTGSTKKQPIEVITSHGRIRPIGTEFAVRRYGEKTLLVVYDGSVEIAPSESYHSQIINAGEQVVFTSTTVDLVQAADPARRAWIDGILLAQNITLADLVSELSRYHKGYINLSPQLSNVVVAGTFPLDDTQLTLQMLADILPIKVNTALPFWTSIQPAT